MTLRSCGGPQSDAVMTCCPSGVNRTLLRQCTDDSSRLIPEEDLQHQHTATLHQTTSPNTPAAYNNLHTMNCSLFGRACGCEMCLRTDRQTDRQTDMLIAILCSYLLGCNNRPNTDLGTCGTSEPVATDISGVAKLSTGFSWLG